MGGDNPVRLKARVTLNGKTIKELDAVVSEAYGKAIKTNFNQQAAFIAAKVYPDRYDKQRALILALRGVTNCIDDEDLTVYIHNITALLGLLIEARK